MKTTKFIFSFFIIVNSVYINAQLKVFPLGYTIFN